MSLLITALNLKNNHILAGIYLIFKKKKKEKVLDKTWKAFSIPNLDLSEKIGKLVIK